MSCSWKERNDVASFVRNLAPDLDLARLVRPEQSGLQKSVSVPTMTVLATTLKLSRAERAYLFELAAAFSTK
jgi:hypothetical protein